MNHVGLPAPRAGENQEPLVTSLCSTSGFNAGRKDLT